MAKSGNVGKTLVYLLLLGAVGAGGWFYFKKKAEVPPEVMTTSITRGNIVQTVTASGDLQAVTTVDVSSQVSGQIIEVLVDYNDIVKAGQVLARIDPATYEQRLAQAEADLASTEASNMLTRLNTERIRELRAKSLVSQQELDQAEAQLKQSDAGLLTRKAAVEDARVNLSRCTIFSPIDGIVLDRQTEKGKTVSASTSAPTLFVIVNDLAQMQISADVAEADIGTVTNGQQVNFTVDAHPNRQFRGRVSQVRNLPKTAQSVVVYSTIIDVDNSDLLLKPGMTANVSIVVAQRDNVLVVSNAAMRARLPDEYRPAPPERATGGANATNGADREALMKLLADAGITLGTPASPEAAERARTLATERGIQVPERMLTGGGRGARGTNGNGRGTNGRGNGGASGAEPVTITTVYRLVNAGPPPQVEAVSARLGITNGIITEVLDGLAEGDTLVTSITIPGAPVTRAAQPAGNSPFGGARSGGFRR